jgi:4-hydroxybenzoate polyprenyltransferase
VLSLLSTRLLTLLQLTRMALVFTAIADGWCGLLLLSASRRQAVSGQSLALMAGVSVGLYAFGMSLNDLIDRRRDVAISPNRPLPSGRVSPATAQLICGLLLLLAVVCGALYARTAPMGWMSLVLLGFTAMLIGFYDLAGKYLVWPGLITLGLIRFFQSLIAAPQMPVLWHPLLLLNHVAVISMIAYRLEDKRPALSRRQGWLVIGGLALLDAMVIGLVIARRWPRSPLAEVLQLRPGLLLPLIALAGFAIVATVVLRRADSPRAAGQKLMLTGLLWLIVYDAAFVAGYVSLKWAGAILLLLPVAYLSVLAMRWWSTLVSLSQRPEFKRAT